MFRRTRRCAPGDPLPDLGRGCSAYVRDQRCVGGGVDREGDLRVRRESLDLVRSGRGGEDEGLAVPDIGDRHRPWVAVQPHVTEPHRDRCLDQRPDHRVSFHQVQDLGVVHGYRSFSPGGTLGPVSWASWTPAVVIAPGHKGAGRGHTAAVGSGTCGSQDTASSRKCWFRGTNTASSSRLMMVTKTASEPSSSAHTREPQSPQNPRPAPGEVAYQVGSPPGPSQAKPDRGGPHRPSSGRRRASCNASSYTLPCQVLVFTSCAPSSWWRAVAAAEGAGWPADGRDEQFLNGHFSVSSGALRPIR